MLRSGFQSVLVFVATFAFGVTASVAMADKGGGHHGGGHHSGHGHHSSHGHRGHGHQLGHSSHRSHIGHHYGGSRYGYGLSGYGFSRGGISLSIGGGYPYGYGGYGGYGYRGGGYGYGRYGSSHVGIPVYGLSRSIYSPYRSYGYAPYYPDRSSSWRGYTPQPSYGYRYDRVPATNYVVPDSSRQYSQVAPEQQNYSAAKPVAPSDDLRPGMVLPDGSRVVSVQPLGEAPKAGAVDDPVAPAEPTEVEESEPVEAEPVEAEELQPPPAIEPDQTSASL